MKINTNMSAIISNKELSKSQDRLSLSLERLSSGLKLNHSKDDAAGMAISQKMKSQLRGLDRAGNNAQDGISVIETTEGALTEITEIVARMRELAVQAASDTNTGSDRDAIQQEMNSLNKEIDRISKDTEFNMQSLLDGNLARRAYTDVDGTEVTYMSKDIQAGIYTVDILQDPSKANVTGGAVTLTTVTEEMAGALKINGYDIMVNEGDDVQTVMNEIQNACNKTNSTLDTTAGISITSNGYGANAVVSISGNDELLTALGLSETIAQGEDVKVNLVTGDTGFPASATTTSNGKEVIVKGNGGFEMKFLVDEGAAGSTVNMDVTNLGMMAVHIGANENQELMIDIPEVTSRTLNLDDINIMTYEFASDAIRKLDEALEFVSNTRSTLGAYQNRLDYSKSNLDISTENLTSALSRITDADMAEEMTEYTQLNVLTQAGISMLSQANERPESVLQLLQ